MANGILTSRVVVPARPTRLLAAEAAADLRRAVERLEAWSGRPVPAASRFRVAICVLEEVAQTGQISPDIIGPDGMIAFQLAFDLTAIAASLPAERVADLRKDLEVCARGPLTPIDDFQPLQAQSQLVVRAALFKAGIAPTQPRHSGAGGRKKPDIYVENGTMTYALEVKRPSAARNALPRALDASGQIAGAGLTGGVVIDITDCLTAANPASVDDEVQRIGEALSKEFFTHGVGWNTGHEHVLTVTVLARPALFIREPHGTEGQIIMHSTSLSAAFGTAAGSLDTLRGVWLRGSLDLGLNQIGFSSHELAVPVADDRAS